MNLSIKAVISIVGVACLMVVSACSISEKSLISSDSKLGAVKVVSKVLDFCRPQNAPFVSINARNLSAVKPYFSQELYQALLLWVSTRDLSMKNGRIIEWSFNPLMRWKFYPDVIEIESVHVDGNRAEVIVNEVLHPSKIYAGYKGSAAFDLVFEAGSWKIHNIRFRRVTEIGGATSSEAIQLGEVLRSDLKFGQ